MERDGDRLHHPSIDLNTVPLDRASHVVTDSYGVFGQVVWTPAGLQDLHLTLGGRLTKDQKKGLLDTVNGALPSYVNASKQVIVGRVPLDELEPLRPAGHSRL